MKINNFPEILNLQLRAAQAGKSKKVKTNEEKEVYPPAQWLFLNYIAADNNLTADQMNNIDQQEKVGSDVNTHIAAYIDVGHKPNPFDKEWSGCRLYYVTKDSVPKKLNSKLIKDYGIKVDMSNPNTLRDFVVEAVKKFPSKYVALILNDHGGGFTGAMSDDSDGRTMTVPQIRQALEEAQRITGKKIDILGMDACLMAETEVAYELKGVADIYLASEENEGGAGWTYDSMLGGNRIGEAISKLQKMMKSKRINVAPKDFAEIVVEVNKKHNDDIPTFSAVDLTKFNTLTAAVDVFAKAIIDTNEKEKVKEAVKKAENYGGGWAPYKDIHDLYDICQKIISSVTDDKLKSAAENVKKAVNEVVFANENNPVTKPNSHGISIYFPEKTYSGQIGNNYEKLAFPKNTLWDEAILAVVPSKEQKPPEKPDVWPDGSERK